MRQATASCMRHAVLPLLPLLLQQTGTLPASLDAVEAGSGSGGEGEGEGEEASGFSIALENPSTQLN
eukprot:1141511-Pelagomonas_calceolata.AAC.4